MGKFSRDSRVPQSILGFGFLGAGAACVFFPRTTLNWSIVNPTNSPLEVLLMRCFGAQAMLVGLTWCTMKPTKKAFQWFGLSMLPFFYFNYWAIVESGMFTKLIWADFVGNLVWLGTSIHGANITKNEED